MAKPASMRSDITAASDLDYKVSRTEPDELLRHDISDEELEMLADMRRDYLWEGMWIALGAALGAAPACIAAISKGYGGNVNVALNLIELAQIIIFFSSLLGFAILGWVMKSKSKVARDLVKTIKDRKRRVHDVAR